jgi:hypothetical protein
MCIEEGYVDAPIDLLSCSMFINIHTQALQVLVLSLYRTFHFSSHLIA